MGRLVLKQIDADPASFDMLTFGKRTDCGTVACLAGHALLLSGYRMVEAGADAPGQVWYRPDGTRVTCLDAEGQAVLGLTQKEYLYRPDGDEVPLFYDYSETMAVERLRLAVEASEVT